MFKQQLGLLLSLLKDYKDKALYHLIFPNLELLLKTLEHVHREAPNDYIEETDQLAALLIDALPLLDRYYQEFDFREHLYQLGSRCVAILPVNNRKKQLLKILLKKTLPNQLVGSLNKYPKRSYKNWEQLLEADENAEKKMRERIIKTLQIALLEQEEVEVKFVQTIFEHLCPYIEIYLRKQSAQRDAFISACASLVNYTIIQLLEKQWPDYLWAPVLEIIFALQETSITSEEIALRGSITGNNLSHLNIVYQLAQISWCIKDTNNLELLLEKAIEWNKSTHQLQTNNIECPNILKNYKPGLARAREIFKDSNLLPQEKQKAFSRESLNLLEQFRLNCQAILGPAPCQILLLPFGSSNHLERMPYSDVELAVVYQPNSSAPTDEEKLHCKIYAELFSKLLELCIVYLNETPIAVDPKDKREGFRLDSSTHLFGGRTYNGNLIKEPDILIQDEIRKLFDESILDALSSEIVYSLSTFTQPEILLGEATLWRTFYTAQQQVLNRRISDEQFISLNEDRNLDHLSSFSLTNYRQALIYASLINVFEARSSEDEKHNLKIRYYRPLLFICMAIKITLQGEGIPLEGKEHSIDILTYKETQKRYCVHALRLIQAAFEEIIRLRVEQHLAASYQQEQYDFQKVSQTDKITLEIIEKAILQPFFQALKKPNVGGANHLQCCFQLILKTYLERRVIWAERLSDPFEHPLIKVLVDLPGRNGWLLQDELKTLPIRRRLSFFISEEDMYVGITSQQYHQKDLKIELIQNLKKLPLNEIFLNLSEKSLSDEEMPLLAEFLKTHKKIKILHLYDNKITDDGILILAEVLKTYPNHIAVDLLGNPITKQGGQVLSTLLETNEKVRLNNVAASISIPTWVDCCTEQNVRNYLRREGFCEVDDEGKSITFCATLVGNKGINLVAEYLKTHQAVEYIKLKACLIGDEGVRALSETLKTYPRPLTVDLTDNPVFDQGVSLDIMQKNPLVTIRYEGKKNKTEKVIQFGVASATFFSDIQKQTKDSSMLVNMKTPT